MFKILVIMLSILFASPLCAREIRGPQQFTVTRPDGSMTTGQFVPETGQVIMQTPGGPTVMHREPNNNWRVDIEPPAPAPDEPAYGYDGDHD